MFKSLRVAIVSDTNTPCLILWKLGLGVTLLCHCIMYDVCKMSETLCQILYKNWSGVILLCHLMYTQLAIYTYFTWKYDITYLMKWRQSLYCRLFWLDWTGQRTGHSTRKGKTWNFKVLSFNLEIIVKVIYVLAIYF